VKTNKATMQQIIAIHEKGDGMMVCKWLNVVWGLDL
jgi:hypothetical protein